MFNLKRKELNPRIDKRTLGNFSKDCYFRLSSNFRLQFAKKPRTALDKYGIDEYGWVKISRKSYLQINNYIKKCSTSKEKLKLKT